MQSIDRKDSIGSRAYTSTTVYIVSSIMLYICIHDLFIPKKNKTEEF